MATFFFIVGCPRSGTTLLQRMLDAHPRVAVTPETHFMRRFWARRWSSGWSLPLPRRERRLSAALAGLPEMQELGFEEPRFRQLLGSGEFSLARAFRLVLEGYADRRGVTWVGEKTPNHQIYLDRLRRFFPGVRFIQIVRDPRAVVASWKKVPWSTGAAVTDAEIWRRYARQARTHDGAADVSTVRYEALVTEPAETLRHLCGFLGLDFRDEMLSFHQGEPTGVNVEREPWKERAARPLTTDRLESWRRELDAEDFGRVEAVAGTEMDLWGYDRSAARVPPLSFGERARLLQLRARHAVELCLR